MLDIDTDKTKILKETEEEKIRFIRLQFTDMEGIIKNVEIPRSQLKTALEGKIAFDGSSIEGFAKTRESDMYLKPDPKTFCVFPWGTKDSKIARLNCDVYTDKNTPFEGCPRRKLKGIIKEAKDMGYSINIGPEPEFFLFKTDDEGKPIARRTHDRAGYFDLSPTDQGEQTRRDIVLALEDMGFEIEASHHEVAEGQHEIDFKYADPLTTADRVITFKFVTRQMAFARNLYASFMPKPVPRVNGSCMHTHISMNKDNQNVFFDESSDNQLSTIALYFIGGILKHAEALTAITNPTINSYKRLQPGYEAPTCITWAEMDRNALIRVPTARGASTRLEVRSPDPSCNPYLAFACIIASGLWGIKNKVMPKDSSHCYLPELSLEDYHKNDLAQLPRNLISAIEALEKNEFIQSVLGDHLSQRFINLKQEEWYEYVNEVHDWEIDRYLSKL